MREAAVMVIVNKEGKVLGVSRRYDKTKFGLPGGKLDPEETSEEAAIRETFEETNVMVHTCTYLYKREEAPDKPDGEWFYTYCYLALSWSGEATTLEEGEVKWLTVAELTDPNSAFPEFNTNTFNKLKDKHPRLFLV
jgi:8-oxo-dGTP diphosphatase